MWRSFGAWTEEEAYGYWVQQFRRQMGLTIVREFARLRISQADAFHSLGGGASGICAGSATGASGGWCMHDSMSEDVSEVPEHGRHAGDFFVWAPASQGRMYRG